jgi:hypothetical protein
LDELALMSQVGMQTLDSNEALEPTDSGAARQKHRSHATGSDLPDEFIAIDALPIPGIGWKKSCCNHAALEPSFRANHRHQGNASSTASNGRFG